MTLDGVCCAWCCMQEVKMMAHRIILMRSVLRKNLEELNSPWKWVSELPGRLSGEVGYLYVSSVCVHAHSFHAMKFSGLQTFWGSLTEWINCLWTL